MYYMYHVPLWHDQHLQSWLMATAEDADKLPTEHSKFNISTVFYSPISALRPLHRWCQYRFRKKCGSPCEKCWGSSSPRLTEVPCPASWGSSANIWPIYWPKGSKREENSGSWWEHLCLPQKMLMGSPDIRSRREKNGCKWKSGGSWHSAPATLHQAVLSSLCKVSNVRKMIKTAYDSWLPVDVASSSVQTPDLWLTKD